MFKDNPFTPGEILSTVDPIKFYESREAKVSLAEQVLLAMCQNDLTYSSDNIFIKGVLDITDKFIKQVNERYAP